MPRFPHTSLGEEMTNVYRLPGLRRRVPRGSPAIFYKNVEHQKSK